MASRERFELALQRIDPARWVLFEQLAAAFLAAEFPSLRTLSVPEGDAGRDGALFAPVNDDSVALQYSVTENWAGKIRDTAKTLREKHPNTRVLIYVSNQLIGARADDLKREMQKDFRLYVDVRDINWFLDRQDGSQNQQAAAERLSQAIVDPLLASRGIIESKGVALTNLESRAALVYLGLQWEDDTREKGLTKLSFEGVVKSVLRESDPEHRIPRADIRSGVRRVLPTHDPAVVDSHTDAALSRMAKRYVRHYQQDDEFCLSYEERQRLLDRLAEREKRDRALQEEIASLLSISVTGLSEELLAVETSRIRRIAERYLLTRGEDFASSVAVGNVSSASPVDVRDVVIKDIADHASDTPRIDQTVAVVTELLDSPGHAAQSYLRSIADSYTLLAFLRETPDVQSAVNKMFSHGEIWLDTSVVLPLFAEVLAEEPRRTFTSMLRAAVAAGMDLRVTSGVVEELERHMNRSATCASNYGRWQGRIPFLYQMYALSGRSLDRFNSWLETFRGNARPEDDLKEYLAENFGIHVGSLEKELEAAPQDLRIVVQELFAEIHATRRRRANSDIDEMTMQRLAHHDTENYVGGMWKRRAEDASGLGHRTWWLTLDRAAFEIHGRIAGRIVGRCPDPPTLSPDFLINYLALGPRRAAIPKTVESNLPLIVEGIGEFLPPELLTKAEQIRNECRDLPENVIRRRVRDGLDQARRRMGVMARGGSQLMETSVGESIVGSEKRTDGPR